MIKIEAFDLLNNIRKDNHSEFFFILLVCMFWGNVTCYYGVVFISKMFGLSSEMQSFVIPLAYSILAVLSLGYWVRKIKPIDIILYILIICAYLSNYVFYPENEEALDIYVFVFPSVLLCYFIGLVMEIDKTQMLLYYISVVNLLCSSAYYFLFTQADDYSGGAIEMNENAHNMSAAYEILPSVIYIIWITFKNSSLKSILSFHYWLSVIFSFLGFFLIISMGTRGPLVCILFFVSMYLFFLSNNSHKFGTMVLLAILGLLIMLNLESILLYMVDLLSSLNMSSRIFQIMIENSFMENSSSEERISFMNILLNEMTTFYSFFGHGFAGSYRFIQSYPHNIIYEVFFSFGYVVGGLLIILFVYLIIKSFHFCKDSTSKSFLLLLLSCGFVHLLMSNTFLQDSYFFLLIGYCVKSTYRNINCLNRNKYGKSGSFAYLSQSQG